MHILIASVLAGANVFAHGLDRRIGKCQMMLGAHVSHVSERGEETIWTPEAGVGPRGVKSTSWPPVDAANVQNAHEQMVYPWSHTIALARTVEDARAHDRELIPYKQTMYIVTDESIAELLPTHYIEDAVSNDERVRRLAVAQWRAGEIFRHGHVRMVWFREPKFDPEKHWAGSAFGGVKPLYFLGTDTRVPREMVDVPHEHSRAILHPDEMGIVHDEYGTRFIQNGWFLPPFRGISMLEVTFKRKEGGKTPDSGVVRKAYDLLRRLSRQGWTVEINTSIDDVLALEKATIHNVGGGEALGADGLPVPNSRYLDPEVEDSAREAFARGNAFTFELRDPRKKLVAASLGFFGRGRHIMFDAVGGTGADKIKDRHNPNGGRWDAIDLRKAMMVAAPVWAHEVLGYPFVDSQVVSSSTGPLKAFLAPAEGVFAMVNAGPTPPRGHIRGLWTPPEYDAIYRMIDEAALRQHIGPLIDQKEIK